MDLDNTNIKAIKAWKPTLEEKLVLAAVMQKLSDENELGIAVQRKIYEDALATRQQVVSVAVSLREKKVTK